MHQMFSIGERSGLQAGQFITRILLLRSYAVVIAAVCGFALSCWNTQGLPWNRLHLEWSICCSKTFIYLSAFIVPSKTYKLPIPYALIHPPNHQRCWVLNWMLITRCLNELWPTGHDGASGPCSHMASFLHDRALVGICRLHAYCVYRQCFLEVFLGPFSNVNDRIMPMSDAALSEGPKTTGIQQNVLSINNKT